MVVKKLDLNAALFLAEKGYESIVLEGVKVGWGASGKNGGHLLNFIGDQQMAMRLFGNQRANYIGRLAGEGISIVKRLIKTYGIKCDLKSKNIFVAFNSKQMKKLKREHQLMQQYAIKSKLLDKEELKKL